MPLDGLVLRGVLAHQYHRPPAEGHVALLHLLGTHIVCSHTEEFWVTTQELDDLKEAVGLLGHGHPASLGITVVCQGWPHRV